MIWNRVFVGLTLLGAGSSAAHAESATVSCFLSGDYPDASSSEKDRILALSFVVDGVQTNTSGEQAVRTDMIADRHKVLGGYPINKIEFLESGTVFVAEQSASRAVAILVPEADGTSGQRFPAFLRGMTKDSADVWASMDGICSVILTADGAYDESFMDGVHPLVEQSASEEFRRLQGAAQ